jgi:hypothetical protein
LKVKYKIINFERNSNWLALNHAGYDVKTILSSDFLAGTSIVSWINAVDFHGNLIFFYRGFQDVSAEKCRPAATRSARDSSSQPFRIGYSALQAYCPSSLTRENYKCVS